MPFLTEELFQRMKNLEILKNMRKSIVIEKLPISSERIYVENDFSSVIQAVRTIRSLIDTNEKASVKGQYIVKINKPDIVLWKVTEIKRFVIDVCIFLGVNIEKNIQMKKELPICFYNWEYSSASSWAGDRWKQSSELDQYFCPRTNCWKKIFSDGW